MSLLETASSMTNCGIVQPENEYTILMGAMTYRQMSRFTAERENAD